jgi:hypothetical protein
MTPSIRVLPVPEEHRSWIVLPERRVFLVDVEERSFAA